MSLHIGDRIKSINLDGDAGSGLQHRVFFNCTLSKTSCCIEHKTTLETVHLICRPWHNP